MIVTQSNQRASRPTLRKRREEWGTHLWSSLPFHTVTALVSQITHQRDIGKVIGRSNSDDIAVRLDKDGSHAFDSANVGGDGSSVAEGGIETTIGVEPRQSKEFIGKGGIIVACTEHNF